MSTNRDIGEEILEGLKQAVSLLKGEETSSDSTRVHLDIPSSDSALEEDSQNE